MTNIVLAWLLAVLVVLLMAIWPLRLLCTKGKLKGNVGVKRFRQILRKIHATLGIVTTIIVFMHCRLAEEVTGETSLAGAILLACMLGLCITWFIKRFMPKLWLTLHRGITVIMFLAMIFHSFIEFHI
jgi:hypothetical protein